MRIPPAHAARLGGAAVVTGAVCALLAACGGTPAPTVTTTVTAPAGAPATTTPPPASTAPANTGTAAPPIIKSPPANATAPGCLASQLSAQLGQSEGAAGTFYQPVVLTNKSTTRCTLYGYPGVSFVTAPGGSQVGAAASRYGAAGTVVTLAAGGGKASFLLGRTDVGVYSADQCSPTSVNWLKIYPPGDYDSLYVQLPAQTCAKASAPVLKAGAVQAGANPG